MIVFFLLKKKKRSKNIALRECEKTNYRICVKEEARRKKKRKKIDFLFVVNQNHLHLTFAIINVRLFAK